MTPLAHAALTLLLPLTDPRLPPPVASGDAAPVPRRVPAAVVVAGRATLGSIPRRTLEPQPPARRRAVVYSDAYGTRVTIHRRLSYAMLPLFVASYLSGDQLLAKGSEAPAWARSLHRPAATGSAILFGANAVTGGWNLWEGRRDPNGRARRIVHAITFLTASAGFTYAGAVLAEQAERSADRRRQHRTVALASMGLSTAGWLGMLLTD
jgi:hypothetical protein